MQSTDTTAETLTADQLDALIADAPHADPCAFVPTDEAGVNWVLDKMASARARAARIRENGELLARAEERKADALEFRFGPALQAFARQELAGGKRKSVRLFHGVLGYRTKPAGVTVTDEAAALSWAQENDLDTLFALRLDKKALADVLLSTGEAVPFANFTPETENFYIK